MVSGPNHHHGATRTAGVERRNQLVQRTFRRCDLLNVFMYVGYHRVHRGLNDAEKDNLAT